MEADATCCLLQTLQLGFDLGRCIFNKGVHIFPKGIIPKVNVIAWLGFEIAYYDVTVLYVSHYATMSKYTNSLGNEKRQFFLLIFSCSTIWLLVRSWFGLFFLWHVNFPGLFNAKAVFSEEHWAYYLIHSWGDKGIHTFSKGISPKLNVIVWLDFEHARYDIIVLNVSHYTTSNPPRMYRYRQIAQEWRNIQTLTTIENDVPKNDSLRIEFFSRNYAR